MGSVCMCLFVFFFYIRQIVRFRVKILIFLIHVFNAPIQIHHKPNVFDILMIRKTFLIEYYDKTARNNGEASILLSIEIKQKK